MINRLTYTVIDCYWGPKESITITSNNKSFQLLIDKFRQSHQQAILTWNFMMGII